MINVTCSVPGTEPPNLLVLLGATATGKTALAVAAARRLDGEIISADSRQVYRGMDIGTGKDLAEYADVPYHLIDIAAPGQEFNLFEYQRCFRRSYAAVRNRGRLPLMCGGSGMYLETVLANEQLVAAAVDEQWREEVADWSDERLRAYLLRLQPQQHNTTDLHQRQRLLRAIEIARARQNAETAPLIDGLRALVFGLRWPRAVVRKRIGARLRQRLDDGMVEEVRRLHADGVAWSALEFYGLEYRFIARYLQSEMDYATMVQGLERAIGKFAKRQETWFRRMEKRGCHIHWLDGDDAPLERLLESAVCYGLMR